GDKASELVRDLAREPGAFEAHLVCVLLQAVIRLADACRGERVRGRDVGAGFEVAAVNAADDLGPREVQEVGVARDVARMLAEALAAVRLLPSYVALDQHPPRTVEHHDSLAEAGF